MKILKVIWQWLNGKKLYISLIYGAILTYCQTQGYVNPDLFVFLTTLGGILFGIGAGHKIDKIVKK